MPRKVSMPGGDSPIPVEEPAQPVLFEEEVVEEIVDAPAPPEKLDDEEELDDPTIYVEELDPDTILWANGPTAGQVAEWKRQYKNVFLTSITPDDHVIWRAIDRKEYRNLIRHMEKLRDEGRTGLAELNLLQEEIITSLGALFPSYKNFDFSGELAGLPSILSQQILESSGFQAFDVREL